MRTDVKHQAGLSLIKTAMIEKKMTQAELAERICPAGSSCDTITMRIAPLVSETRWMYMDDAGI